MSDHSKIDAEQLATELEAAGNFMRGATLDRRLHPEIRDALHLRATRIDELLNRYLAQEEGEADV